MNALKCNTGGGSRHYGIDLLRIVAMFMVCVLHVNLLSGSLGRVHSEDMSFQLGVLGSESVCIMGINLFALITGYVSVLGTWRFSRYIRLWMQVAFYTVGIFVVRELLGQYGVLELQQISLKGWFKMFSPIPFANVYWYFTAYTPLFLLIPFLNVAIKACSKKQLGITTLLICAIAGIASIYYHNNNVISLIVLYIVGAYFRLYAPSISNCRLLLLGLLGVVMTFVYCKVRSLGFVLYVTPSNMLAAIAVFLLLERLTIRNTIATRLISTLAPFSFGVYLIHVHPFTWGMIGRLLPRLFEQLNNSWWLYVVCPVALYLACSLIDFIRALLFNLCRANAVADLMERVFFWTVAKVEVLLKTDRC